ncbi:LLM class flavin-dependent oxidoreductase [Oceanobacillus piezotolerans]|uniref:LLM class flavin-dependent oxidoreductase n=1 Tax=Oceanobacillus piezotolerans TaxID=2448030 RepID=A0A498D831_9BACI|nr:LLM class flavin-dependent oxidoreductase [Oceanobacillus piezotolerans]RLL43948.1 LLM class flavin-dependent oxidoreductase [Oceanobacillus piezotolerans]
MKFKLGILDQSPIFKGKTAANAFQHTIQLAIKAEEWGYSRFWVSEHHNMEQVAGSSPEVLISHLIAHTNTIQIGSGGVMLQHYSPYKVAENFNVLSTLAPGRVDLGIGKAPGGLPLSTKALQNGNINKGKDFNERLAFLKDLIDDSVKDNHPLSGIQALPKPEKKPEIYLLGRSTNSASFAADLKVNFVFAGFLNSDEKVLQETVYSFKSNFKEGKFIVALAVLAAPTQEEAEKLAEDHKLFTLHLHDGRTLTVQSKEQVKAYEKQAEGPFEVQEKAADIIVGTPEYVKGELTRLHYLYKIDEFILHTPIRRLVERFRSFQLLRPLEITAKVESKQS